MAFLVGGANSLTGGYNIANSLRFNDGDSAYLSRAFDAEPDSRTKFTFSFWVKRGAISESSTIVSAQTTSNFRSRMFFQAGNTLRIQNHSSGNEDILYRTSWGHEFVDPTAWNHIVFIVDTSESDGNNGVKLYIDGVLQTYYSISTYNQNATFEFGRNGTTMGIGRDEAGGEDHLDGYLSEFYYIDNQALAASNFGEFDEDSLIWKPKKYEGSYGANGFFLEFKESAVGSGASDTIGADTSGNDEHFTSTNVAVVDNCTDTPTNNFATLNALTNSEMTFSEGDTKTVRGGTDGQFATSTFEVNKGKWYFESQLLNYSGDSRPTIGLSQSHKSFNSTLVAASQATNGVYFLPESDTYQSNSATAITDVDTSPATNDIYHFAFDLDNLKFYIGKGGTWYHSSDPSAGSNGLAIQVADYYAVATGPNDDGSDTSRNNEWFFNFGNPAFAISSSNADANGYGNFEYAVPSGFYALCTKNLAEFG